ncbi:RNA-binding protein Cwf29 [Coemansia sp. RSA 2598]|nr:RNA-binding protein Cwf29 [Coemansia sp. RSA 2598]
MNSVREIERINRAEARLGAEASGSWHDEYKDSAYIFAGGIPFDLTEGDVICIFSQYGEIVNINLVRDKDTGKSKGYAFLQYEDQRSTILAVDNLNGAKVLGRTLRVDHVKNYRQPNKAQAAEDGAEEQLERPMNAAPKPIDNDGSAKGRDGDNSGGGDDEEMMRKAGIDPEDPMAGYYLEKYKKRLRRERGGSRKKDDKKKRRKHRESKE